MVALDTEENKCVIACIAPGYRGCDCMLGPEPFKSLPSLQCFSKDLSHSHQS